MAKDTGIMPLWQRVLVAIAGPVLKLLFIGGTDSESVLRLGTRYRLRGFEVSYDLMLENVRESRVLRRHVYATLHQFADKMTYDNMGNIVVKPSMLGLGLHDVSPVAAEHTFAGYLRGLSFKIMKKFPEGDVDIEIDAETHADLRRQYAVLADLRRTSDFFRKHVRLAVQMHSRDMPEIVDEYKLIDGPIRIVKGRGVYRDDASIAVSEAEVLARYRDVAVRALHQKTRPYLATMRDRKFIMGLIKKLHALGYSSDEFEIQMLHGIGMKLARELRDKGYIVRIYIPFVMPWCADAWKGYVGRRITMFLGLMYGWYAK